MDRLHIELQQAVQELFSGAPLSEYVKTITDGMYDTLINNVGASPERKVSRSNKYTITEGQLTNIFQTAELIVHLVKIYEASEVIERCNRKEKANE